MATEFENFISTELPLRPISPNNEPQESILVRRGIGPRVYEAVVLAEGEALGKSGGVLTSVPLTGTSVDNSIVEINAGEDLGGYRVVKIVSGSVFYSDPLDPSFGGKVLGLTRGAVTTGSLASVQTAGKISDALWTLNDGVVYNGPNGVITQTAPTTGFVIPVGVAISPTEIIINIQQAILRS